MTTTPVPVRAQATRSSVTVGGSNSARGYGQSVPSVPSTEAELNIANLLAFYTMGGEFPQAFCPVCRTCHNQPVWYCML